MARLRPSRWASYNPVTLHYAYFTTLALSASLIFHHAGPPTPYTDSLFLVVSALTSTGLTTTPLSSLSPAQQAVLCALMVLGSAIWVSFCMLVSRKREPARTRGRGYSVASTWGKEKADPDLVAEETAVGLGSGASFSSRGVVP
ncbi:hypothetical protein IMZ48_24805, partial [Candidatus Bathyarchaeota archaeon]|nr:hypothetical protein [Candidatus Bathyarchaeota archaeon]